MKPLLLTLCLAVLVGCQVQTWNNPHPQTEQDKNTYYASFNEQPKTLDPARSYSANEVMFTAQIYEPPLQYHYLKRPYTLIPLTAEMMPTVTYLDKNNQPLPKTASEDQIAYSIYTIKIKPGIYYQPHPALAKDKQGNYRNLHLGQDDIDAVYDLADFKDTGTRELIAADYVYQIKRLAHPAVQSPIFGLMQEYIVGLNAYANKLTEEKARLTKNDGNDKYLDLRNYDLEGAKVIDRYTYQIKLKGKYPQFLYWLAMPFFAPIPWEADKFYSQAGMRDHNISFDWYPIGTGPYMLVKNDPNSEMVLIRNPNFHGERYPTTGEPSDKQKGLLRDAGKPMPFIKRFVFSLEKESIPRWTKFLQGYYDRSAISSDNFDQAIRIDKNGKPFLSPQMQQKNLHLETSISPAMFYMGFNMLDDVVGGNSVRARKLRQAIAIAVNYEEFISIFLNGRGIPAQGPLPPGIFGYEKGKKGLDPYVYTWQNNEAHRKSIASAKKLLAEAGFPNGRDAKTGKPLILHLDVPMTGGPGDKAQFDWYRKQFAKLGIQLQIRATQYNRFQQKMRTGNAQLFMWGWQADYPDPENFFFLLYGPNGKVKHGGENAANYNNPQFDALFDKMKHMQNDEQRLAIINQMLAIVQRDSPWVWGFYPKDFVISHDWVGPLKPSSIINNNLKYVRINTKARAKERLVWNKPILWPLGVIGGILILGFIPVAIQYWRKERRPKPRVMS